jgi:hypothetical protein
MIDTLPFINHHNTQLVNHSDSGLDPSIRGLSTGLASQRTTFEGHSNFNLDQKIE